MTGPKRAIVDPDKIIYRGPCSYCKEPILETENYSYNQKDGNLHKCRNYVGNQIQIDQKEFFILEGGYPVRVEV